MKCDTLIVDSNFLCHAVKYATKDLSFSGSNTGVIFGFLSMLSKICENIDYKSIAFAWDSQTSLRKKVYPEYKSGRKKDLDDDAKFLNSIVYPQFNLIREEILPEMGFKNIFIQEGYEGDDMMASVVNNNFGEKIIITRDHDLFQCISQSCSVFDPIKKYMIDISYFVKKFKMHPEDYLYFMCITGCAGDGVKGIKGIGPKRAFDYISGKMPTASKDYKKIFFSDAIIERNSNLIGLPYQGAQKCRMVSGEKISKDKFAEICNEYGFKSFLFDIDRWIKAFRME